MQMIMRLRCVLICFQRVAQLVYYMLTATTEPGVGGAPTHSLQLETVMTLLQALYKTL
jgi:hypothetical protein